MIQQGFSSSFTEKQLALIAFDIKELPNAKKKMDGWIDGWMDGLMKRQIPEYWGSLNLFVYLLSIPHIEYSFNSTQQILMESQDHQNGLSRFLLIPGFHKSIWKNKMLFGFPSLFLFFYLLTEQNPKQILKIKIK